jgi:hypothetical protein
MRKDPFSTPRRRRGNSRDLLFGQPPRRRRFPWGWVLVVLLVGAGALVVSQTGVDGALASLQSLLLASDESGAPPPDHDAPVVPLPLPPRDE